MLVHPRFIAMDSSQLGDWCRDKLSKDSSQRAIATSFEEALTRNGWVVLLSWHHLEELLSVESSTVAANRMHCLQTLPLVGWPAQSDGQPGLGSVMDIVGAEIRAALGLQGASALEIRDLVAMTWLRVGTGEQALSPYADIWRELQPHFWERRKRNQEIVAIRSSTSFDLSGVKVADLMNKELRSPQDATGALSVLLQRLSGEIKDRGDKRIEDPLAVASQFMMQVVQNSHPLPPTARELVLRGLLLMEIDLTDLRPGSTLRDVNELGISRLRAKAAAEATGLSWSAITDRVQISQIPSLIIQGTLGAHRQDLPQRKGSDMTDEHLATLAPYADTTYVDKRTKENFRRASLKSSQFRALVRDVKSASSYATICLS